jgi:4-hydroxy-2-oxoheptanedioate aldolase
VISRLRQELVAGRVVGTFVKLSDPEVLDVVAQAGFSFAVVDLEHSQLSDAEARRLVRHGSLIGLPVVVRLPACDRGVVNRLLEAGAAGIQLSTVRRVADVEALVAATRYAPHGQRSVSLAQPVARYGAVPLEQAVAGEHPVLVGQFETAEMDDPLDDVMAAGLDVAFLGVTDLRVDTGFDQERLDARSAAIEQAARDAGVVFGVFAADAGAIPASAGYVALASDLALLAQATRGALSDAG